MRTRPLAALVLAVLTASCLQNATATPEADSARIDAPRENDPSDAQRSNGFQEPIGEAQQEAQGYESVDFPFYVTGYGARVERR
jgi:hypothetical protein